MKQLNVEMLQVLSAVPVTDLFQSSTVDFT